MCVCVCVRERERERESQTDRLTDRDRHTQTHTRAHTHNWNRSEDELQQQLLWRTPLSVGVPPWLEGLEDSPLTLDNEPAGVPIYDPSAAGADWFMHRHGRVQFQISVTGLDDRINIVEVNIQHDTIDMFRSKIMAQLGIEDQHGLSFAGAGTLLASPDRALHWTVDLSSNFQITLTELDWITLTELDGTSRTAEIESSNTIYEVMSKIPDPLGIPADQLRLVFSFLRVKMKEGHHALQGRSFKKVKNKKSKEPQVQNKKSQEPSLSKPRKNNARLLLWRLQRLYRQVWACRARNSRVRARGAPCAPGCLFGRAVRAGLAAKAGGAAQKKPCGSSTRHGADEKGAYSKKLSSCVCVRAPQARPCSQGGAALVAAEPARTRLLTSEQASERERAVFRRGGRGTSCPPPHTPHERTTSPRGWT